MATSLSYTASPDQMSSPHRTIPYQDHIKHDLWLDDGNIVLGVIDHTSCERSLFRIHKTVLSMHSVVFRDIFDAEVSPHGEDLQYGGLPMLYLYDSVEDIIALLMALYKPGFFVLHSNDETTDRALAPVLRMACKYEINGLRTRLLDHYQQNWPIRYEEFNMKEQRVRRMLTKMKSSSEDQDTIPDPCLPDPVRALELSRVSGARTLLPAVYYELVRSVWNYRNNSSSSSTPQSSRSKSAPATVSSGRYRQVNAQDLGPGDVVLCARIRALMLDLAIDYGARTHRTRMAAETCLRRRSPGDSSHSPSGEDTDGDCDPCLHALERLWANKVAPVLLAPAGILDPLETLRGIARDPVVSFGLAESYGLCDVCDDDLQHVLEETQRKWWDELTGQFFFSR